MELENAYKVFLQNHKYKEAFQCLQTINEPRLQRKQLKDVREGLLYLTSQGNGDAYELLRQTYMYEAPYNFDSFMIAMEWERAPKSRFWLPRRKVLEERFGLATKIDNFINDPYAKKLCISTPPGCGKSTLIKFLMAYVMGTKPDSMNMYVSYSDGMVKLMMDALIDFTTSDEYRFQEIFSLGTPEKSSEYNTIGYRRRGDAQTFNMCSIGGSITGRTRANNLLITDDLVKNDEMARSPERLNTLYYDYQNTISTRTIGASWKEIQLGTIWNPLDPISRERELHEGEDGYYFIALPVCDDDGHSNFDYDCEDRYTDEKIAKLQKDLDPVVFSCLYLQRGVYREGMPFLAENLQWYDGVLPGQPDKIFAYCDVAWGGGDSLSMPIAYQYGADVFIHGVVFSKLDKTKTIPKVTSALTNYGVQTVRFEANVGGSEYADEVSKKLKDIPYSCNVTSKRAPNTVTKLGKIEQHQQTIRNFYFRRDPERGKEYESFMKEFMSFSFTQKNLHDDAADSLSGIADMYTNGTVVISFKQRTF